mmetsp:Transcript_23253/g.52743  ORF Transcript_23253/g.52743 Transcript_23253/m.52743 type:complete len:239 (+) Transcript_23253:484-1200(+)
MSSCFFSLSFSCFFSLNTSVSSTWEGFLAASALSSLSLAFSVSSLASFATTSKSSRSRKRSSVLRFSDCNSAFSDWITESFSARAASAFSASSPPSPGPAMACGCARARIPWIASWVFLERASRSCSMVSLSSSFCAMYSSRDWRSCSWYFSIMRFLRLLFFSRRSIASRATSWVCCAASLSPSASSNPTPPPLDRATCAPLDTAKSNRSFMVSSSSSFASSKVVRRATWSRMATMAW